MKNINFGVKIQSGVMEAQRADRSKSFNNYFVKWDNFD
mgnify:CR=1 FL=1